MKVLELSHRLPVFFVGVSVECRHPVHVVLLPCPQVGYRNGLVRIVAHEIAVVQQAAVGILDDGERSASVSDIPVTFTTFFRS